MIWLYLSVFFIIHFYLIVEKILSDLGVDVRFSRTRCSKTKPFYMTHKCLCDSFSTWAIACKDYNEVVFKYVWSQFRFSSFIPIFAIWRFDINWIRTWELWFYLVFVQTFVCSFLCIDICIAKHNKNENQFCSETLPPPRKGCTNGFISFHIAEHSGVVVSKIWTHNFSVFQQGSGIHVNCVLNKVGNWVNWVRSLGFYC